jgi:hypothetical protein
MAKTTSRFRGGSLALDITTLIEISYTHEDAANHRSPGRAGSRTPVGGLQAADRARTGGLACGTHCRAGRPRTLLAHIPSAESAARGADHASSRESTALLRRRFRGNEWPGWILERELLRREWRAMRGELRAGSAGKVNQTRQESRLRLFARRVPPY